MRALLGLSLIPAFLMMPEALADPERACAAAEALAQQSLPGEPGMAIAVLERGRLRCTATSGKLTAGGGVAVTRKTRFYLASMAKPLVAALAIDAAHRGELDLDVSVRRWVPELPDAYEPVTLRLILKHQAGIPDHLEAFEEGELVGMDNASVLRYLVAQDKLTGEPGAVWNYSNGGYVLAAIVIERASGHPIGRLLRKRVFTPAGMHTAASNYPEDAVALAYTRDEGSWTRTDVPQRTVGPGGIHASLDDMIAAFLAVRRGSLIPAPELTEALAPTLTASGTPSPFSLGFQVEDARRGLFYVASFGNLGGYRHALVWFPDRDQAYIFLSARADQSPTQLIKPLLDQATSAGSAPPEISRLTGWPGP